MATIFNRGITKDATNDFSCRFSDIIYGADVKSTNSPTDIIVPNICPMGSLCGTGDVLATFKVQLDSVVVVACNQVATINTGNTFSQVTGEIITNVMGRICKAGDTLSFATEEMSASVTVSFYVLN